MSTNEGIDFLNYNLISTMEKFTAVKMNELVLHISIWINVYNIIIQWKPCISGELYCLSRLITDHKIHLLNCFFKAVFLIICTWSCLGTLGVLTIDLMPARKFSLRSHDLSASVIYGGPLVLALAWAWSVLMKQNRCQQENKPKKQLPIKMHKKGP